MEEEDVVLPLRNQLIAPIVMFSVLALSGSAHADTRCKPASKASKEAAWNQYRARFPYLMQGVARMQGEPGCTLIVVGEPPPSVRIPALLGEIEAAEQPEDVFVGEHGFGGDGWTRDLVLTIDSDTPEQAANTISLLHHYLFGTSFRAWTIDLDVAPPAIAPQRLDLSVTGGDLKGWMLDDALAFAPLLGGSPEPASRLLQGAPTGVYEAEDPSLVAWVLEPRLDLDDHAIEARQFTMAADLILGAFMSKSRLVIVGRGRTAPFEVLPPLRTETLQLLARANGSLGQSYERNSPLAGPIRPLTRQLSSWAPIYLSPELVDTEYGSLLNLTDQLLKSWSDAGQVRYDGFGYPDPPRWPFGDKAAFDEIGMESLTYNWNTHSFAFVFSARQYVAITFRSTGALPLDYISEPRTSKSLQASETGREYFAGLSDPNLVRVVQYAGLYQIFQAAHRASSSLGSRIRIATPSPRTRIVEQAVLVMLRTLATATDARLRELVDGDFDLLAPSDFPRTAAGRARVADLYVAVMRRSPLMSATESQLDRYAKLWSAPPSRPAPEEARMIAACEEARRDMQGLVDIAQLRADYVAALPPPSQPWLHTSTWVVSTSHDMAEGGHNLDVSFRPIQQLAPPTPWRATLRSAPRTAIEPPPRSGGWIRSSSAADHSVVDNLGGTSRGNIVLVERADDHYRVTFGDNPRVIKSWTHADAADAIASATKRTESAPLRLHLSGFDASQARSFSAQAKRMINTAGRPPREIETVAFGRTVDSKLAMHVGQARPIGQLKVGRTSAIGNVAEVRVAARPGGLKGFILRVRMTFKTYVTAPLRARIDRIVAGTIKRLGGRASLGDVATRLNRELAARLRKEGIDVTVDVTNEAGDIWVTELQIRSRKARG